jgi:ABC transport system ATP-binding/permease protein
MQSSSNSKTVFSNTPYLIFNNQGETLPPISLTKPYHVFGRDSSKVDIKLPDHWQVVSRCHGRIQKIGTDYYILDGDGNNGSVNGLFVNHTRVSVDQGLKLYNGIELKIGQNPTDWITIQYEDPSSSHQAPTLSQKNVSLKNRSVLLGRDPTANLLLDSPIISRRHAVIEQNPQGSYVIKDYSTNGVFVNGQKVVGSASLFPGAKIQLGPYTLVLQGDELILADQGNNIRLDAQNVVRVVKNKQNKPLTLLNDISLPIEPGQFVALVGGSGAGKSTLMRTLLGIDPTSQGVVYLNGENLRKNFNIYRTQIGYVPQSDIVHKNLRVIDVLTYAAKLRLPPDLNVKGVVEKTLQQIEMSERRDVFVKDLSGGQLKRVSIGVELLADPKLFFLDEPTSGLDPGLDKKMMQLLRKLADEGRTIVLVTHATTNITQCDRIVFMGGGGHLCYFGPPQECYQFFNLQSNDFADIYIKLETPQAILQESQRFRNSIYYKNYIENRLSVGQQPTTKSEPQKVKHSFFKQLVILTQRYLNLVLEDKVNLILSLITAPIGIILINLAIRDQEPLIIPEELEAGLAPLALRVLFVFTSAALWVGLSTSLQEIVKESAIYLRERLVNLGLFSYLGSKLLVLGGLGVFQSIFMTIAILLCFASPDNHLISWPLGAGITCFLTLFTCMSLGLMVSAMVKNSTQANSALPLLLIPQIIFSGVLFDMEGAGKVISWLMLSSWSVRAFSSLVDVNSMVPELPEPIPGIEPIPLPFEGAAIYNATWENLGLTWAMLGVHSLVYLTITLILQKRKDIL